MAITDTGTQNDSEATQSRFFYEKYVDLHRLDRIRDSILQRSRAIRFAGSAGGLLLPSEIEGFKDELKEYGGYLRSPADQRRHLLITVSGVCLDENAHDVNLAEVFHPVDDAEAFALFVPQASLAEVYLEPTGSRGQYRPDMQFRIQGHPDEAIGAQFSFPLEEVTVAILTPRN